MSHYTETKTEVKDIDAFIDAICEMWPGKMDRSMIEFHDVPTNLVGYQNDQRSQLANIIIRKQYVGGASNDVGWMIKDGQCTEYVSDYDRGRLTNKWTKSVRQSYGRNVAVKAAKKQGYRVKEERIDGKIKLTATKSW